jgi:hypothetical protein
VVRRLFCGRFFIAQSSETNAKRGEWGRASVLREARRVENGKLADGEPQAAAAACVCAPRAEAGLYDLQNLSAWREAVAV